LTIYTLHSSELAQQRIQVRQLVPGSEGEADGVDVDALASTLRPELVQLWYQMAVGGRRDIDLAPSARVGFEMSLLRMLAFRPGEGGAASGAGTAGQTGTAAPGAGRSAAAAARAALQGAAVAPAAGDARATAADVAPAAASAPTPASRPVPSASTRAPAPAPRQAKAPVMPVDAPPWPEAPSVAPSPATSVVPAAAPAATPAAIPVAAPRTSVSPAAVDAASWPDFVAGLGLRGPARELAASSAVVGMGDGVLRLSLPAADDHLRAPLLVQQLADALAPTWGAAPQIRFESAAAAAGETLHARNERARDERQGAAESTFLNDPDVQRLMERQGARVVPDSIRPIQEQEH